MIGFGVARVHAMAYRAIPLHYGLPADMVNIVGIAETSQEKAQRAAQEIGCTVWTANFCDLLARDDIDVIDCSVPNNHHQEIVVAAANAHKHIYCEKPLAMNVAQGRSIVEAAEKACVKTQMNFNYRPDLLPARRFWFRADNRRRTDQLRI